MLDENEGAATEATPSRARWGAVNWMLLAGGAALLAAGFFALSRADASAENLPATVSPFCLLGGYALLFLALLVRPSRRD